MAPNLTARDADGTAVPLRERTVADRLRAALREAGVDDAALADELAAAVVRFVGREHGAAAEPPTLDDVDDLIERVLGDAGHESAARAFARERRLRARLRHELLVTPTDDAPPEATDLDLGRARRVEPWSAADWARRLAKECELPAAPAEEVVSAVERRLGALGLKSVSERLVRELLQSELVERGLAASVADDGLMVARRDVERAIESSDATPEHAIAGPLFVRAALASLAPPAARAHREGALHLFGLDRPAALERLAVSTALLAGDEGMGRAASRLLLRVRSRLERLRPHVAGTLELPDLVGAVAARATSDDDPVALAEDLLATLVAEDAFDAPVGPLIEATVPIDGFEVGAHGEREAAVVKALLARFAAEPERRLGVRLGLSTDGSLASTSHAAGLWPLVASLLAGRSETALVIRRDAADDPFLRDARSSASRKLRLSPARVGLNLPLAFLAVRGGSLKDALSVLDVPGRLALDAFHERLWRQRRGAAFGVHGVVVLFGGPGAVAVEADGQEADLEAWGLPLALELLMRRHVVGRSQISEAAARILGYLDFLAGEERDGLRLRVRLGGVREVDVRRRFHAALERRAPFVGADDVLAALKTSRGGEGVLPVVAPLFDPRNAPLLAVPCAERLGPGFALSTSCLAKGLEPGVVSDLASRTRFTRVAFAPVGAGDGLFEVQEELFRV
jgi:hypothetical protein